MEFIFEFVLQFLGELLLQVLFEGLFELGAHSLADTLKEPKNRVLSGIGFLVWGSLAGVLSLFLIPNSLIANPLLRRINLVVTPFLAGALMTLIGRARSKRGQDLVRIDRFGYAFCFAFAMALARFVGTA